MKKFNKERPWSLSLSQFFPHQSCSPLHRCLRSILWHLRWHLWHWGSPLPPRSPHLPIRISMSVPVLSSYSLCLTKSPVALTVWWVRVHLPLGMNLQYRFADGYKCFRTGPTDPRQKRWGVGRYWGPQPPTKAANSTSGQTWRQASRAASGSRRRWRRWQSTAPGLTRPVPGSRQFRDPEPIRRGTKVKDVSGAERRNSRIFTFPRILGNLGNPTRPYYVFLRDWPSSVRGFPKSGLCLYSALDTA